MIIYDGGNLKVAEYISSKKNPPVLCRLGVNDLYPHASSYQSLLVKCGLDVSGIEESILKTIGERNYRTIYNRRTSL